MRITHTIRSDERRPRQLGCAVARVLRHPFTSEPGLALIDAEGTGTLNVWLSDDEIADLAAMVRLNRDLEQEKRRRVGTSLFPEDE